MDVEVGDKGEFIRFQDPDPHILAEKLGPVLDMIFGDERLALYSDEDFKKHFAERFEQAAKEQGMKAVNTSNSCFSSLFTEMAIGWEGLEDEDGGQLPFNNDNVQLVKNHNQKFAAEVVQEALSRLAEKKVEVAKNCGAGLSGNLTQPEQHAPTAKNLISPLTDAQPVTDRVEFSVKTG